MGMDNLSFVIINAKDSLAQLMYDELDKRVSIPVYQDNNQDDIWKVLEGGKDDMYIYDGCGRLTFYIPFPLSIIHPQQPIVSSAVYTTYHNKLCGDLCFFAEPDEVIAKDYNESLDDNTLYVKTNNSINETDILDIEDIERNLREEEENNDIHEVIVEDVADEFSNIWENETNSITSYNNTTDWLNDTAEINNTVTTENETKTKEESFWSWAFHFFSNDKTDKSETPIIQKDNDTLITTDTNMTLETNETEATTTLNAENATIIIESEINEISHSECKGDYLQRCSHWRKEKLQHARDCCKFKPAKHHHNKSFRCKHFGWKRCKKLLNVIKCCLETTDPETTTHMHQITTNRENGCQSEGCQGTSEPHLKKEDNSIHHHTK